MLCFWLDGIDGHWETVDLHGLAWDDAIDTGTVKILADCGVEDAHLNKKKLKVTRGYWWKWQLQ